MSDTRLSYGVIPPNTKRRELYAWLAKQELPVLLKFGDEPSWVLCDIHYCIENDYDFYKIKCYYTPDQGDGRKPLSKDITDLDDDTYVIEVKPKTYTEVMEL